MATFKLENASSKHGNCGPSSEGFEAGGRLHHVQKCSLSPIESLTENRDTDYNGDDAWSRRFSLSSNDEPFIENCDGRHKLHEEDLHPRVDRGRYNIWRKSSAFHYVEDLGSTGEIDNNCRGCGSRRCNRGSECRNLLLNNFQPNIGGFESKRKYDSGGSNWNLSIDKGSGENQHCSFDHNYSTNSKITGALLRKRTDLCQKFLKGQCLRGASCFYVHDVGGRHIPYMLADLGGRLSLSTDNSPTKDGYSYSENKLNCHSSKHPYRRCMRGNADADGVFKKRRTEATWRHEDSYYFEEDGRISRNSIAHGGHLQCGSNDQSREVRRGNETISDKSQHISESKGVREFSNGDESSGWRSESSDLNFNSCTRSREMNINNEKQLTGKHSRKSRAVRKPYSFKRKKTYYHVHKRLHLEDEATVLCKYHLKGYCRRGNTCWFSHETDSSKAHLDLNKERRSVTKQKSAASSEIPPGQDLSSTNNSNRLLQKKNARSGLADKSMLVKSTAEQNDTTTSLAESFPGPKSFEFCKLAQAAQGNKCSETSVGKKIAPESAMRQECVDNGYQDGKGDDGCANYIVEATEDKDSSDKQLFEKKELFADPSLLIPQNLFSEIPNVNTDSCVIMGKSVDPLMGHHASDQADPVLSTHKQHISTVIKSVASYTSNNLNPSCSTGCYEKLADLENFQEALVHDVFVGDDNTCGIQEQKGNNKHINDGLFTASSGVRHSTRASTNQVGEEMFVYGTIPFPSDAKSAACSRMPATEEEIFNDIGHDMSLDDYIYQTLSLERYACHMDDENKATTPHCTHEEQKFLVEDSIVAITSTNLVQGSNVHFPVPSDGISETTPVCSTLFTGLSPTSITSNEVEETAWKPNFEQHDNIMTKEQEERPVVKLEPISLRNTITKEPNSSQKEGTVTTVVPQSSDKHADSLSVAEPISKELVDVKSYCHSKQNESLSSEQKQQALNPKERDARFEANEKYIYEVDATKESQKFSSVGSRDVGCKRKVGNKDEDEKSLLKLAVLQLAKSILNPLWEAGRIKSKEIYKSITRKVVDKVCVSVQGVNIPRTKESVDQYLLHHKPRIAQLVLAYVNMYPVSL